MVNQEIQRMNQGSKEGIQQPLACHASLTQQTLPLLTILLSSNEDFWNDYSWPNSKELSVLSNALESIGYDNFHEIISIVSFIYNSGSEVQRQNAVMVTVDLINRFPEKAEIFDPLLRAAQNDKTGSVRETLARGLCYHKGDLSPSQTQILCDLCNDSDKHVKEEARYRLGRVVTEGRYPQMFDADIAQIFPEWFMQGL